MIRVEDTNISGLKKCSLEKYADNRGAFFKLFDDKYGVTESIKQINHSITTKKGGIRGLHYQVYPSLETKIVHCTHGKIWDVVVDLRKSSSTYLEYFCCFLSEEDEYSCLIIPPGCAHGFQNMKDVSEVIYLHTEEYSKENERVINAFDPILSIPWPETVSEMSERDKLAPFINAKFKGVSV